MNAENTYCVVLTTANNDSNTQQMITELLSQRLAACIQTMPISSHYVWEGKVCQDQETLIVIKTQQACYGDVERLITSLHDYDVPEIIQLPITEGFNPYLSWITQHTQKK
ncbi:divalent-cation tolerance protein CutA [Vibrio palustris]|uniref:Divalent-cation tolerance protein CutA n=1 Tax=Vibrio palustris TaxID=1918946 RepID=A0A1R4B6T7_9VIBR|nr:divalent-cation tolerance protein CutA [Vibrio palustris]SJL84635.1 Divalent-cation tolerance protein CutA [Vibrio palustris]